MSDREDLADVRRVLDGEVEAFEGIVRRWQGPLVNLAWRLCRDRGRAEEMAQEAFLKAYRSLARFRGEASFSTWLFALATNHYRSCMRRLALPVVALDAAGPLTGRAIAPPADDGLEAEDQARAVRAAVLRLPARYRDAIVLYYFSDMDLRQAAGRLGVREGTLKARLHRARALLRKRLGGLVSGSLAVKEA